MQHVHLSLSLSLSPSLHKHVTDCREYNDLVESVAGEVEEMSHTQERCVAEQMRLDEESLQRIKEQEAKQKVNQPIPCPG